MIKFDTFNVDSGERNTYNNYTLSKTMPRSTRSNGNYEYDYESTVDGQIIGKQISAICEILI